MSFESLPAEWLDRRAATRRCTPYLVGWKFGKLRVVGYDHEQSRAAARHKWKCACSCGALKTCLAKALLRRDITTCGCGLIERAKEMGRRNISHGATRRHKPSREYLSWCAMKKRCTLKAHAAYDRYGGRGVTICSRWMESFENFLADMGSRPAGKSLDRHPNKDGNYEPGNCRWATSKEQNNNRSDTRILTIDGITQSVWLWSKESGIRGPRIRQRLAKGWDVKRAVFEKLHSAKECAEMARAASAAVSSGK